MMIYHDTNKAAFTGAQRFIASGIRLVPRFAKGVAVVWTRHGNIFCFVAANWPATATFKMEATMRAAAGSARVRLENITDFPSSGGEVTGSELSTSSSTQDVYMSGPITLVDGKKYRGAVGQSPSDDGKTNGANVVVFPSG